jgi:N-methylhydantoinase A/oxoprolinase/acetone carboxylase beta subunit
MPGPGLPYDSYRLFPETYFIKGSIDFRGREVEKLDNNEVDKIVEHIHEQSIRKVAVAGKFSNRNSEPEKQIKQIILDKYPDMEVVLGSEIAGQLNFRRRIVTSYYSVMTRSAWSLFINEIEKALQDRKITAPLEILKADGGTMSVPASQQKPCETIFSGPAASTMGAVALRQGGKNSVVLDIGGTTSDISLLIEGKPLYASRGAKINGLYTHVNAFSVRSVALGGDSPLKIDNKQAAVDPRRQGVAACFGGTCATVTDLFNYKYKLGIGDSIRSGQLLGDLAKAAGMDLNLLMSEWEDLVINQLQDSIQGMYREWENEPAYRVWEVVNGRRFEVHEIIGIGAAAQSIVPVLAKKMQVACYIPPLAAVANALGACLARPTLALNLHIDTQDGVYSADQDGINGRLENVRSFQLDDARSLASKHLYELARQRGIGDYASEAEFYRQEQFNVIRG